MTQLHIVHVLGSMDPGRAELRTMEMMQMLSGDVTATYVTLSGRPGTLAPQIVASGGQVIPIALGPRFPDRFLAYLRRSRPAVLHTHVQDFSGAVVALGRVARVPIRITHYRSEGDGAPDTIRRRAYRRTMKQLVHAHSTSIVGVSPTTLDTAWGPSWSGDPKFTVIPNAFVLDSAPPTSAAPSEPPAESASGFPRHRPC